MTMKVVGLLVAISSSLSAGVLGADADASYGVDCSFAVSSSTIDRCGDQLGDKAAFYHHYIQGCRDHYAPHGDACDRYEQDRIARSVRQPQSMVNYTSTGYKKIRAPAPVMKLINEFWEANRHRGQTEKWDIGNAYQNYWESPSYMVNIEDPQHRGGGQGLRDSIWEAAKSTIEEWTGMEQLPSSLYGIRVYTKDAILSPHVDRLPLVSSAIVNVAQEVDEPWPLEVYDRDGKAVNITMEPGDMVLYESHSLIHGRPFPLKGRFFANIFIHFEPSGRPVSEKTDKFEPTTFHPPYILPDSPEIPYWTRWNPNGWRKPGVNPGGAIGPEHDGHKAAATNDLELLKKIAVEHHELLHFKDANGWQPIHQAVREGHVDAVKLLLENGADMNARTHMGKGFSPLNIAIGMHSENHPVTMFLKEIGALDFGSEL